MPIKLHDAALALALVAVGCVDPHPAHELDFVVDEVVAMQTSGMPSGAAMLAVTVRVEPTPEHTESRVELGRTTRFPAGVLRAYEPTSGRFVYDERKPLLAVPASTAVDGRRAEGVAISDAPRELRFVGQISNLELDTVCGREIVLVPRLVVSDVPDEDAEGAASIRDVRIPAATEVVCD